MQCNWLGDSRSYRYKQHRFVVIGLTILYAINMQKFITIFEDFLVNTLADEILSDEAENKRIEVINTLEQVSSNLKYVNTLADENKEYVEMKRCSHEHPYKPYVEIIANVGTTDCQYQEHGSSKACNSTSEDLYQNIREIQANTDSDSDNAVEAQEEYIRELKSLQGRSSLLTEMDSFHELSYEPYVKIVADIEHGSLKDCNSTSELLYQRTREFQADTDSDSDDAVDAQEEFIRELKSLQGRSSLHTKIDSCHSGYLLKAKRKLFKQHWVKVYVVIRDGMALLYESENAKRAMEIIILTGYDMMEIEVKMKRMEIQLIPVNNIVKRPRPDHRFRCELDDFLNWQKAFASQKWTKRGRRSRLLLQITHLFDSFSDENDSDRAELPVVEETYRESIDCYANGDNELQAKYPDKDPEKTSRRLLEKAKESGSDGDMGGPDTKKAAFRKHLEEVVSQNSPPLPRRNIPPRPAPRQKRQ